MDKAQKREEKLKRYRRKIKKLKHRLEIYRFELAELRPEKTAKLEKLLRDRWREQFFL